MGSRKSENQGKLFGILFKYIDQDKNISKDLIDSLLDYGTVLYLKSNDAIKSIFWQDLVNVFQLLKLSRESIFIDRKFNQKIQFTGISQARHCLLSVDKARKEGNTSLMTCEILSKKFQCRKSSKL